MKGIAQCYNNLGKIYVLIKDYSKAQKYFENALKIGNADSKIISLGSLSKLFEIINDYEQAYFIHHKYTELKDSLFNEKVVKEITEIETNYKLGEQKKDYELVIKKEQIKKEKSQMKYYIIGSCLFFY